MTNAEIIAKLIAGTALTEEEKGQIAKFDLQKELDATAANSRRKAEESAGKLQAEVTRLNAELEAAKHKADDDSKTGADEIGKLTKTVERLQQSLADMKQKAEAAEAAKAALERTAAIDAYAKGHGLAPIKGVSETTFNKFFREAVGDADLADKGAMDAVVKSFKEQMGGIIAVPGVAVPGSGNPLTGGGTGGANPFAKESFNLTAQGRLYAENPEAAKALAAAAGL